MAFILLLVNVHIVDLVITRTFFSMSSSCEIGLILKFFTLLVSFIFVHFTLGMLFKLVLKRDSEILFPDFKFVLKGVRRYLSEEGLIVIRQLT
jgi:hypothetical protein